MQTYEYVCDECGFIQDEEDDVEYVECDCCDGDCYKA